MEAIAQPSKQRRSETAFTPTLYFTHGRTETQRAEEPYQFFRKYFPLPGALGLELKSPSFQLIGQGNASLKKSNMAN